MYFKTTYDQQFDDLYMHLKAKYPDKLFDLDGIGKQLDMSDFSKNFFSSDVNADASIDANANVDDISVIAYNSELPKPFFRLNSYYVLWNELRKEYGLEVANDIVEKNLTGDIYINDFHGVGGGLPYSYYGKTVLVVKVNDELIYTTFEDLYNLLAKEHEEKVILDSTQIYLKDVKILDKDNKWVNVSRILKHKSHTDLVKIETKNGMCTIVTKDHPVILNEDMNEKLAGTLTLSDTVLCSNSDLIFTEEKMVSIPTAYKCGKQQESIVPCDILTWDKRSIKAFLGGVIDRRGHVNKNGEVIITSYSFDFIQKVAEIVRWLGYGLVKTSFQGRATFNSKNEVYQCNIILLDSSFGLFSELIQSYKDLVCNVSLDICYDYTSEISKIELMDTDEYVYDITTDSGHFHCQGLIQHNCFNYSTLDIHQQGLPMVKKVRSLPPKHLYAYKSQLEQFVTIASNSTLGATGLSDMLVVMSHYVDKILKTRQDDHFRFATEEDCWRYVKGNLASFIYTINQPMRGNQCVTEDTEVLTPDGFKKYNELKAGDLTYTWKDGKLNIQQVERVNIYDYDGEMHEYSGRDTIQVVTPSHRVLYKKNNSNEYRLTASENLINKKTPLTYPVAMLEDNRKDFDISDELLKLCVFVLTDGNIDNEKRGRISIFKSPNRWGNEELNSLISKLGLECSIYQKPSTFGGVLNHYNISTESSQKILKLLNFTKKEIPSWFTTLSKRQANIVIDLWAKLDGSTEVSNYNKQKCQCDNYEIADVLQQICFLAGRGSKIISRTIGNNKKETLYLIPY